MLVLFRRTGERVRLRTPEGRVVWVTLCLTERGQARIGIEADRDVSIAREEVLPLAERHGVSSAPAPKQGLPWCPACKMRCVEPYIDNLTPCCGVECERREGKAC